MAYTKITVNDLDLTEKEIINDKKYGRDLILIEKAFKQNKFNTDISQVAMKVSLIDLTHGTNLLRNLGKNGGLYLLSKCITEIDFDNRVAIGDLTLVNDLLKWTKEYLNKNLISFITKYCTNHNYFCYGRDDYVIYDSVIKNNIIQYINKENFQKINNIKITGAQIESYVKNFKYEKYKNVIDFIIKENNISTKNVHRKIDWYIWYKNKNK